MNPRSSPSGSRWVGAAIFVAAAVLRLALMQSARFGGDEARDYAIAVDIAHGRNLPLLGPSITGGHARLPGPLYNWMTAVPRLVTKVPEAGNVFFELLSAATVWMFWLGLRRPFGEVGAAFAAMLMALSPWSALFGDRVWNPHAFLFVEGLALLGVLRLREEPGSRWAIVVPCACLALPQLHMSAPVVWLALLPLAAGNIRRWNRRYLLLGIGLGLLLYIPYTIHEARTGLDNTRAFLNETFAPKKTVGPANFTFLLTPVYALRFLTLDVSYHELTGYWGGLDEAAAWRALWSGSQARPFHPLRLITLLASIALLLLALAAGLRATVRRGREHGWRAALGPFAAAGLLAVGLTLAFLGLARKQVFAHYVALTLPFVFAVYAPLAQDALLAWRARGRLLAPIVLGLAILFCLGGIESTLTVSGRIDGRIGLGTFRMVSGRVLADLAQEGRAPAEQPVSLSFGFFNNGYAYGILSRIALPTPIRWDGTGARFAYRLQKPEDPPPPGSDAFPATRGSSATLYRLR